MVQKTPRPGNWKNRDRDIAPSRITLSKDDLPESMISFLNSKITTSKGGMAYKHVTKYQRGGFHAQRKRTDTGQTINLGVYDDPYVAAVVVAASYMDEKILSEPLASKKWLECMITQPEKLEQWIGDLNVHAN
jgi:hypothetical protein